ASDRTSSLDGAARRSSYLRATSSEGHPSPVPCRWPLSAPVPVGPHHGFSSPPPCGGGSLRLCCAACPSRGLGGISSILNCPSTGCRKSVVRVTGYYLHLIR